MSEKEWIGPERRSSGRDDLVSAIASAVREEIASVTVPEEKHRKHHDFIQIWIDRQQKRDERNEKLRTQITGWAMVTLLGGIGTGAYNAFIYMRDHLK